MLSITPQLKCHLHKCWAEKSYEPNCQVGLVDMCYRKISTCKEIFSFDLVEEDFFHAHYSFNKRACELSVSERSEAHVIGCWLLTTCCLEEGMNCLFRSAHPVLFEAKWITHFTRVPVYCFKCTLVNFDVHFNVRIRIFLGWGYRFFTIIRNSIVSFTFI